MERAALPPYDVSRETAEKLRAFEALLLRWTKSVNLIGKADRASIWERHILDCLQLTTLLPPCTPHLTDLGSGAGFPGMVLAIADKAQVTLIEADQRKAAFLHAASAALDVRVTILTQRIELRPAPPAQVVTARALASLNKLLPLALPMLLPQGFCLFMKGETAETELTLALNRWQMKVERFASRTSPGATIFKLSEIARA